MSWDVFLFRVPAGITRYEQLPSTFYAEAIGSFGEVVATLRRMYPEVQFIADEEGWINTDPPYLDLHILPDADGNAQVLVIKNGSIIDIESICHEMGCLAIDPGTGDFLRFDGDAEASFQQWQRYRDYVVGLHSAPPPNTGAKGEKDEGLKPALRVAPQHPILFIIAMSDEH